MTSPAARGAALFAALATDMIPHHQQAAGLSAMVPGRSSDPAVVELAAAISAAQQPEIETMKVFLVQWNGGGAGGGDGHEGTTWAA